MLAELAALALACAPNIHPVTLKALIQYESGARQYAIGVNRKGKILPRQPHDLEAASQAAERLITEGIDFDAGLGQINVRNWDWLGLTSTTVFDPCRNLAATQTVLSDCYARALDGHRDQQQRGYSIADALNRIGSGWAARIPAVARQFQTDLAQAQLRFSFEILPREGDGEGYLLRLLDHNQEVGCGHFPARGKSVRFADDQCAYDEARAAGLAWLEGKQAAVLPALHH